jgi:predicted Zn finger-like uncharacterized protein
MAELVAQCPQCKTAFRVTDEQMQSAHGAVRCGSCLHIFMAPEHQLQSEQEQPTQPENLDLDDDILIHDDLDQELNPEQVLKEVDELIGDNNDAELNDTFIDLDSIEQNNTLFIDEDHNHEFVSDDEAWAKDLLEEIESEPQQTPDTPRFASLDEEFYSEKPTQREPEQRQEQRQEQLSDEFTCLDEEFASLDQARAEPETGSTEETEFVISEEPLTADEPIAEDEPFDKDQLLSNIKPDPVVFKKPKRQTRWLPILWTVLTIGGLAGLAGQFLQANFEQLAKHPSYRPAFAQSCELLGCQLPDQQDTSSIRTTNLIIRSHPDSANALIMDVMLTNHANFNQPYPILQLSFTDIKGELVAVGEFQPRQYLQGELLGSQVLVSKQPIHISLELNDPGPAATNYQLQLRAAK